MSCGKQMIYIVWKEDEYSLYTTDELSFDLNYWYQTQEYTYIASLTDYLSLGLLNYVLEKAKIEKCKKIVLNNKKIFKLPFKKLKKIDTLIAQIKYKCDQVLKAMGYRIIRFKADKIANFNPVDLPSNTELKKVRNLLNGRILFFGEIEKAISENNYAINYPLTGILQYLYLTGKIEKLPAITLLAHGEFYCYRCGGNKIEKTHCSIRNETCYFCEECLSMGASHWCDVIFAAANNHEIQYREVFINFDFKLAKAQYLASESLRGFIVRQKGTAALVWAVCGAGKTEICFAAIKEILEQGGKVLFAIPRRDVVIELENRIKKAFPQERVVVLYGGSDYKYKDAEIVLATTHQTIRFYKAFDLIILDEADAFPYTGNHMLYYSLKRARKNNCRTIYMSATPNKAILKEKPYCIKVPVRHHGRPLPVPQINIKKNEEMILQDVIQFINSSKDKGYQVFIFVPTISQVKKVGQYLKEIYKEQIQYSYAGDKNRDEKRNKFAQDKFIVFVTTTIMERGITVPKVNVIILHSDFEKVFDEGTLVQMAGRAGRSKEYNGQVVFFASCVTESMQRAIANIKSMNREASKMGVLKE